MQDVGLFSYLLFLRVKSAPHGFEPWSQGPGPCMIGLNQINGLIGHYTTGL